MPFFIFEGSDGAGKSTIIEKVRKHLERHSPRNADKILCTKSPGATPLGQHIRKLVKHTSEINPLIQIDDLSRQVLFMVDTINFTRTMLIPALDAGKIVLLDRSSFISSMIYGTNEGVAIEEIRSMFNLIQTPKADKCFIITCDPEVALGRMLKRRGSVSEAADHYDDKPLEFAKSIVNSYRSIHDYPPDIAYKIVDQPNLVSFVSTNRSADSIADAITSTILPLLP
jgi:dTMP kinase